LLNQKKSEINVFLGPRENAWFPKSELQRVVSESPTVSIVQLPSLIEVARRLADCKVVVTNDSGILHLAEAVGTHVLAFYGPTVREFGYFPQLNASRVMEIDISCRPCSRNGKRACHRGDLACLEQIAPNTVLNTLVEMGHGGTGQ
ncbi:MAG: heptosyltransferase-2, partial [Candidatus Krumholzibacteriia bacterium]